MTTVESTVRWFIGHLTCHSHALYWQIKQFHKAVHFFCRSVCCPVASVYMCIANKRSRGLIVDVFYIADTDQLFASGQVVTATYPDPVKSPTWYISNYYTSYNNKLHDHTRTTYTNLDTQRLTLHSVKYCSMNKKNLHCICPSVNSAAAIVY